MVKMQRTRAGHYQTTLDDGAIAEVEYMTTGYGDSGWVWWCDGNRADYPVDTKRYAIELLKDYIEHCRPALIADRNENAAAQLGR